MVREGETESERDREGGREGELDRPDSDGGLGHRAL